MLITEYEVKFQAQERELKHVHVWSDGCGGQFKNRNQVFWLTQFMGSINGLEAASDGDEERARTGRVRVVHHFFQSCHGKGPSDSEGAVVKSSLRDAELKHHKYVSQPQRVRGHPDAAFVDPSHPHLHTPRSFLS